jgi:tRNA nucleotidyltransferase/poly(A) polymerase
MKGNVKQIILDTLREFSTPGRPVYLVGGGVRDLLLDRPAHDLDFVLPGGTRRLAQDVSCRLKGALYVLDEERDTTRVVLNADGPAEERVFLDFASIRAATLEEDLRARDFTIGAIAIDVAEPGRLIDPTGGFADLREGVIRACSPTSLSSDPVRVLRAVRQALSYHFRIETATIQLMRAAAPQLNQPSAERVRDELFRMLDGGQVTSAIRLLDQVGALPYVLPELEGLKGVTQSAPHVSDVWEHTLHVTQALEQLWPALVGDYAEETAADLTVGSAVLWLGRYRGQLQDYYQRRLVPDRSPRALLFLAALYHDIAKPLTRTVTNEGRVRFLRHDEQGSKIAAARARALALSADEVQRVETIIAEHMRVHFLSDIMRGTTPHAAGGHNRGEGLARRSIYRFFKDVHEAGIDVCLLSLADTRGTYGTTLPQELWRAELETCRDLFEAYWERSEEIVSPPRYLSGHDLMQTFGLKPGRVLGKLLAAIREAQAVGEIHSREEALSYARQWIEQHSAPGETFQE